MNYRRVYIQNSKIFITIVANKRRQILIKNIDLLRNSFNLIKEKIKFNIDAIVILPDHLHMIIEPKEIKKYPEIIKGIKANFSRNIDKSKIEDYEESESRKNKNETDIWQRRYWEHSIIDENDLPHKFSSLSDAKKAQFLNTKLVICICECEGNDEELKAWFQIVRISWRVVC